MQDTLFIGNYAYSSWSLRGWLLYRNFGLTCDLVEVDFSKDSVAAQMPQISPARTVPSARMADGALVWDSLAMAEELASRHPKAGFWPAEAKARAVARSLTAEMHSGFLALREDCPMNLSVRYTDFSPSEAVLADLARIETIWAFARDHKLSDGPWLLGDYCVADAFYAPVAGRIAGHDLPVSEAAQAYVNAHLSDPAFREWRAMGERQALELPWYTKDNATGPWPDPDVA